MSSVWLLWTSATLFTFHFDGGRSGSLYARKQSGLLACVSSSTETKTQTAPPIPRTWLPKNKSSVSGKRMIWLATISKAPPVKSPVLLVNANLPWTNMTQWKKAAPQPVANQVKFVTNRMKLVTNQSRDQERMTCAKKVKSGENEKQMTRGRLEIQKSCSHTSQLSFFALAMLFMSLISFLDLTLSCTEMWLWDKDDHC